MPLSEVRKLIQTKYWIKILDFRASFRDRIVTKAKKCRKKELAHKWRKREVPLSELRVFIQTKYWI